MTELKAIRVLSSAKSMAGVMAIVGLIAGIIYSFGGAIIDVLVSIGWITSASTPGVGYGTALAFLALIGMPVIFASSEFILGTIGAFLYNVVAGWIGGIEMVLEHGS